MSDKKIGSVLNIQIQLDEIWIGEDGTISDALREEILAHLVNRFDTNVRSQCEQEGIKKFMEFVQTLTGKKAETFVYGMFKKFIANQESFPNTSNIPYDARGKKLEDYVWEKLANTSSYSSFGATLEATAKKIADEMKKRYDLEFANKLVQRLHENKMLKDDVATMLLEKPNG